MHIPVRLIETTKTTSQLDFLVEAASPEDAVSILSAAHRVGLERGSGLIVLPDGRSKILDPGPSEVSVAFVLLDENGTEIRPLSTSPVS